MTLASIRDDRSKRDARRAATAAAGFVAYAARELRAVRWVTAIYVAVALATPLLLLEGPVSMPPAAPVIAEHAMDGSFTVRLPAPAR